MKNYSASDGDTKMKNKLRKARKKSSKRMHKNRGSRVRVVEADRECIPTCMKKKINLLRQMKMHKLKVI